MGVPGRRLLPLRIAVVVLVVVGTLSALVVTSAVSGDVSRCERFAAESSAREAQVSGSGERVAVIGDSYSAGLGLADPTGSWPSRLPGEVHVYGFSGSGFSARASSCGAVSFADRAERATRALRGDNGLVVVQGGLNDHDQSDRAVRLGVRRLLEGLAGRPVLLVGPPPAPARARAAAHVDALLAEEAALAGVPYVGTYELDLPYLDDQLHLTPEGHRAFGDAVAAAFAG
ncbi:SGNH/GDSL hydrolase family protein [Nocardioides donggukensis]|uniref:SGNH/GDSL hydrolase family protein n=1 Tax=Nocardioides donggukensis TaxID=2774019 RepID=A0A927Q1X6_9ACTN|nr:SGNH/GDSL hydrolase family protein [Nocardioides donggukensis]MBD8870632.1 SGNH/GDSL hydrolase family protein [Nocardioides donggukensis]